MYDEKVLWDLIYDYLDDLSIKYNIDDTFAYIEFWTDTAGQDVIAEFDYDGSVNSFIDTFYEYADNYDVDAEVELYVGMRGQNGVPSSVRELVDDCQEAKDTLMNISEGMYKIRRDYERSVQ